MEGLVRVPSGGGERWAAGTKSLRLMLWLALPGAAVLLTVFHYELTNVWWLAAGERMANFDAAAPFQYRVLLPLLVAGVHAVTRIDVDTLFALTEVAGWMLLVIVAGLALRSFQIVTGELARRALALTVTIPVAAHLLPPDLKITSLLVVKEGALAWGDWRAMEVFRYVYDLPAAVFTLALVVVLHRLVTTRDHRWLVFYLGLFVLALLNRETALFLVPVFLAVCWRVLDRRTLAGALLFQFVAVVTIQSTLQWLFADNVNPHANVLDTQYENHLAKNLALLSAPLYLGLFLLRFAAGLWFPVLRFWHHMDPFLARTLLWFGVPFLAATLVFGRVQEHRILTELAPLLWLGAVQALVAYRAGRRASPPGDTAPVPAVRNTAAPTAGGGGAG